MNVNVFQSIWRRIRRPSKKTLRELRNQGAEVIEAPDVMGFDRRLANRIAGQNLALLIVLESHERGLSNLSPAALAAVRMALHKN